MYKIIIDTKGSEKGPAVIIAGACLSLETFDELEVALVGDKDFIKSELKKLNAPLDRIEIIDAPDEITNFDNPMTSVFEKPNSSLIVALDTYSKRDDICGMLNSGNTGALLTGAMRFLPLKVRMRPAMAATMLSAKGTLVCLLDSGSLVDCSAETLLHFAYLGSDMMKEMYGFENPRVGLLSNGSEPTKGNKVVKEAHKLIAESGLNFIGNVEGNTALDGCCDVVVCDGFAGNQVLKVTEGTAKRMLTDIVKYAKETGSQEIMGLVKHLMKTYDIASIGGGIILGISKPVIKTRGSADERTILNTSRMLLNMAKNKKLYNENKLEGI